MNVVVQIDGREAIPVRAIPLLTDWTVLSPDVLADILSGAIDHWPSFEGLMAYRLCPDDCVEQVQPREWAQWIVRGMRAISDAIKAKQTSHETGYQQWRREALAQLPEGVFVWRDEFEAAYLREYGPSSVRALVNPHTFNPNNYALNFNPQPGQDIGPPHLVMAGFKSSNGASTENRASNAQEKKWTPEMLAELAAYRATHTMQETAEKFGITQQRIRKLLPRSKPASKGYSAFTHRPK